MIAHHPTTGQPIRILRAGAQIYQDNKTTVWIRPTMTPSPLWNRWHTIVSEPEALAVLGGGAKPACIIVGSADPRWTDLIRDPAIHDQTMIVAAGSAATEAVRAITPKFFDAAELFNMYPFLGEPINESDPMEKIVVSVAHILRFRNLAWSVGAKEADANYAIRTQLNAWKQTCDGRILSIAAEGAVAESYVPQCWLIQQYFKHPTTRRAREIWTCLEKNIANPLFDRILLLNESADLELPKSDKLVVRTVGGRMTYADVLRAIKSDLPANSFAVFANSDIWFDASLSVLWTLSLAEKRMFLALLRWEDRGHPGEEPVLFGPRADSQDAWILAKETVDFDVSDDEFGFTFGKSGCDNAIAVSMLGKRCLVANPAYSLKAYHIHASNIRNYDPRDILYRPVYMHIDPTPIQSFEIATHLSAFEDKDAAPFWKLKAPKRSFSRKIAALTDDIAKTICVALNREASGKVSGEASGEIWGATAANTWTPPAAAQPLYSWKRGGFVSDDGLVSTFRSIIVGNNRIWRERWQASQISSLSPSLHVPAIVAACVPQSCWSNLADWCLHYLPLVLRVRTVAGPEPEFIIPALESVPPFLYDCMWNDSRIGTIPHMPDTSYYANTIWAVPPHDGPTAAYRVSAEDIMLLRHILPATRRPPPSTRPTIVFCVGTAETALWTEGWAEEVVRCHGGTALKNWNVAIVKDTDAHAKRREKFQQAAWIVGDREALKWLWMAPANTKVVELVLETAISSEIPHLAGAAGCTYIANLVRKEPVEFQREHALIDIGQLLQKFAFGETVGGFREMVELWAERGYCRIERSGETPYVWWGGVGETVLYDKPTARWWDSATPYQFGLFGCCPPPGPTGHEARQSVWSFWPKSPRAVEASVEEGLLGWKDRTIASVFLGRIENGVQQSRRTTADWGSAVELFSMPVDSTGGPYPYSQSEYLAKLRAAKFGLCLAGYGAKCNREIECMALGVVPIITAGVDVQNYLVPLVEGVHYLRAETPADVAAIVARTTQADWERMSSACHTWWRENASAEGLFRLTWARIDQCRPYFGIGIPPWRPDAVAATASSKH
jgi:hypothetical protein